MERLAYNTAEAARMLGKSKRTLEAWRDQGRGPQYKREGKSIMYPRRSLERYLEATERTIEQPERGAS
jgi:predicted site-specific integrase-resolvase